MSKGLLPSLYQVSTNLLPNNCDIYDIYSLYHHYRNFWGGPGFADERDIVDSDTHHFYAFGQESFKPFNIDRRTDDDLPRHVKGAALWEEINDEEGYWVYDILSGNYLAIEYEDSTEQWYFIQQDSRMGHWVATQPVPSTFNLGRRAIRRISVTAVPAEDVEKKKGQYTVPTAKADSALEQPKSSAMATQTSTSIAALTLARTNTGKVASFLGQGNITGSGLTPSRRMLGGGPPGGPPGAGGSGGGGFPSGGPPGGGGPGIGGGAAPGAGGANGKLGGNPPTDFNGTRALADQFMQEFNLYCLTNIDAEQMVSPMKRVALLLGFIKGPNVKDWVKRWTNWIINEMNTGRVHTDEHYWTEVLHAFQQAFQDTGARE
ncbi:hypothetical protein EDB89DRAFT_2082996 [Lactarius sanguifluus]|nr:hypothetical protein EDB89DRAFT_2082996 [Lactarius sanguifluus]